MKKRRSDLLQGTLDLIILKMLQAGEANGYEITQRIQVVSKDVLNVNYGSLYPALYRLEERGWITSNWAVSENNRRAKYYKLTADGRKQLAVERQAWERFSGALEAILRTT
jgi:PadR family transcriptional regulator PadR